MNLLLDTQVALWWLGGSPRLSKASRRLLAKSHCAVSVVSIWEVAIKHRVGRLAVPPRRFRDELAEGGAVLLALTDEHVLSTSSVPLEPDDPFDRLLLAVADSEDLELLTADTALLELRAHAPQLPIREA